MELTDGRLGIFPSALAIGLAWLIFARRQDSDGSADGGWNPNDDIERDEDDERDDPD